MGLVNAGRRWDHRNRAAGASPGDAPAARKRNVNAWKAGLRDDPRTVE